MGTHVTDYGLPGKYVLRIYVSGLVQIISYTARSKGRPLKPHLSPRGYYTVDVFGKTTRVHNIVAETIFGPLPKGMCVNHKDGNKLNNHPSNLEYITLKENLKHAWDTGLMKGVRLDDEGRKALRRRAVARWYQDNKEYKKEYSKKYYKNKSK